MTTHHTGQASAAAGPTQSGEDDRARRAVRSLRDPLVRSLEAEWRSLVDGSAARVAAWAVAEVALGGCRDLDDLLRAVRQRPDPTLAALLVLHRDGDRLAGRVVVQTMLPKMIALARRDRLAGVDDYVACLWIRIGTYPLDRRPARIAANLALDALKAVLAERSPELAVVDGHPDGPSLVDEVVGRERMDHNAELAGLSAVRVIRAAHAGGLIDRPTRSVLTAVYADGLSGREAARRQGVSVDMVRWRCSRGVRRMAARSRWLADCA